MNKCLGKQIEKRVRERESKVWQVRKKQEVRKRGVRRAKGEKL